MVCDTLWPLLGNAFLVLFCLFLADDRPPANPKKKKKDKPNPAISYLQNIGGGLSVVALIDLFFFPQFYWYGVS
jgi:hypothetical protein